MPVIEGRNQLDRLGQQHPVAEHIARHVAAADYLDRIGLDVDVHLAEMPLDRNPGAPRGDAHRLVVVAVGTTARESIVQPEATRFGDCIGDIGKPCGALVGGDYKIGVFPVEDHDILGVDHLVVNDVVGDRQQRADEDLVAGLALGGPAIAIGDRIGQLLGVETALGPGRYDHRVLDPLGLHQAEDFGAEIVAPVGPAQATARDRAGPQMDPLDPPRIDEDLAPRDRSRQVGNERRFDLEGQRFIARRGKCVGSQNRVDHCLVKSQQTIVVDRLDLGEATLDRLARFRDRLITALAECGVVARGEQRDQRAGDIGGAAQRIHDRIDRKAHARLTQIAIEGAQQVGLARGQRRFGHQPVERIALGLTVEHGSHRLLDLPGALDEVLGGHS